MKKTLSLLFAAALGVLAFSSCQKETVSVVEPETSSEPILMTVTPGSIQTKTFLEADGSNYKVKWSEGDQLAVFEVGNGTIAANKTTSTALADDAANAEFTFDFFANTTLSPNYSYVFVYPAGKLTKYEKSGNPTIYEAQIPYQQTFESSTFDKNADVLISEGVTDKTSRPASVNVAFERIGATALMNIKAPTTTETIEKITFSTTEGNLAGYIQLDPVAGTHTNTILASGAKKYIELTPKASTTYTGTIPVWFRLGAITLSDNFTVIVKTNEKEYTKKVTITSPATLEFRNSGLTKFNVDMSAVEGHVDYVTLPFNYAGGTKADLEEIDGVTASGLGSDYAPSHAPYRVKFDSSGDYIQIKTNAPIGDLSVGIKLATAAISTPGTSLEVKGSIDGESFNDIESFEITGTSNQIIPFNTSSIINTDYRYIRIVFEKNGTNIAVGPISLSAPKTLDYISLSGTYKTAFYIGDEFNYDGLIVTANYTDATSKVVTPTSVSTPDLSTAGTKTVTVTFTYNGITKTENYDITVSVRPVFTVTLGDDSSTLTETVSGAGVNLPSRTPDASYTFVGWCETNITVGTKTIPTIIPIGLYHPESNITLYPVYSKVINEETWTKVAYSSLSSGDDIILLTETDKVFNGSISSSGRGASVSTAMTFDEGVSTTLPSEACVIRLTSSGSGFTMYNSTYGYLYATKAAEGGLAWHAEEDEYWYNNSDAWTYSKEYGTKKAKAILRTLTSSNEFRTYSNKSNQNLVIAKKGNTNFTYYKSTQNL